MRRYCLTTKSTPHVAEHIYDIIVAPLLELTKTTAGGMARRARGRTERPRSTTTESRPTESTWHTEVDRGHRQADERASGNAEVIGAHREATRPIIANWNDIQKGTRARSRALIKPRDKLRQTCCLRQLPDLQESTELENRGC
jgi:hypothetical protein